MARILLADDSADQLRVQALVLEAGGHEVLVAPTVSEALRQMERAPDLVLMDLKFPNADGKPDAAEGLALIRRIRELGSLATVFLVSGWPEEIYGRPEEGMVARVMVKPVPMAELLAAISEVSERDRNLPSASR